MTGVPFPELIERVIHQESRGNPNAVSPVGAAGLMQIMPATAADPGYGVAPMNWDARFDATENRRFGTEYLGALLDAFGGDQERALVAYNWGAGNAQKWDGNRANLPAETQGYLAAILGQGATAAAARPQPRPDLLPDAGQTPPDAAPLAPTMEAPAMAGVRSPTPVSSQPIQVAPLDLAALLSSANEAQNSLAMLPR